MEQTETKKEWSWSRIICGGLMTIISILFMIILTSIQDDVRVLSDRVHILSKDVNYIKGQLGIKASDKNNSLPKKNDVRHSPTKRLEL